MCHLTYICPGQETQRQQQQQEHVAFIGKPIPGLLSLRLKKKKKSLQCICHFCKCLILSPDVVVRTKQMGVLKLNDVVHVPGGPCFLMPPLLLPSVVMNLRRPQRTLKEAAGGTR